MLTLFSKTFFHDAETLEYSLLFPWTNEMNYDYTFFVSEIVLLLFAFYHLFMSLQTNNDAPFRNSGELTGSLIFAFIAGGATLLVEPTTLSNNLFIHNQWVSVNRFVVLGFLIILTFSSFFYFLGKREVGLHRALKIAEFPFFISLISFFMLLLTSAFDFITLYLTFEGVSLILMVLVLFNVTSFKSSEAAVKYFCLSVFTSGLFIFGVSLLYGLAGSTHFVDVNNFLEMVNDNPNDTKTLVIIAIGLTLSSFLFKIGAAPYHLWVGEVYEGTDTTITLLLMVPVKLIFFGALAKLVVYVFSPAFYICQPFIMVFAVTSLVLGTLSALLQDNLKKFFAISSINQVGFLLLALTTNEPIATSFAHLFFYLIATVTILVILLISNAFGNHVIFISDLQKLYTLAPFAAYTFTIALLSMAGLPPLIGFFTKYAIFRAAIDSQYGLGPVFVALVANLISAFYYTRLIKNIFWVQNQTTSGQTIIFPKSVLLGLSILSSVLVTGVVFFDWIWELCQTLEEHVMFPLSNVYGPYLEGMINILSWEIPECVECVDFFGPDATSFWYDGVRTGVSPFNYELYELFDLIDTNEDVRALFELEIDFDEE